MPDLDLKDQTKPQVIDMMAAGSFEQWLKVNLANMCDADPEALAKYVLALVKKNKPEGELKKFCHEQLEIFLLQNTKLFVEMLFDAIRAKTFDLPDVKPIISAEQIKVAQKQLDLELQKDIEKKPVEEDAKFTNTTNSEKIKSFSPIRRGRSRSNSPVYRSSRHRSRSRDPEDSRSRKYGSTRLLKGKRLHSREEERTKDTDSRDKKYNKFGNEREPKSKSRNTRRSRSNSTGSERHRSRSYSSSSGSRTPERAPGYRHEQSDHHRDIDYRQKKKLKSSYPNDSLSKQPKRCQDFDEKGYCMKGESCPYDHGADPIQVDDVSALGVAPPPLPAGKPTLPPLPPGPPVIKSAMQPPFAQQIYEYVPEPYNPEVPGINLPPREAVPFWLPPPPPMLHLPPPPPPPHLPCPPPPPPGVFESLPPPPDGIFKLELPQAFVRNEPRMRELIGIQTVESYTKDNYTATTATENNNTRNSDVHTEMTNQHVVQHEKKMRGFDFRRLGPKRQHQSRCALLVKKIPAHQNTISALNDHFSKFGEVVNLQVGFEGDPEAALVQFRTHGEALTAYRAVEPVLNNRFIRIFWYNPDNPSGSAPPLQVHKQSVEKATDTHTNVYQKKNVPSEKIVKVEKVTRQVFLPSAMKKTNTPKVPPPKKTISVDSKQTPLAKRMKLNQMKQVFLKSQLKNQSEILMKLEKCKGEERAFLMETLKAMSSKVMELQTEIKKESEELKTLLKAPLHQAPAIESASETEKELLDAEMDLYNKQHAGEDVKELMLKVAELKLKAKILTLKNRGPTVDKAIAPTPKFGSGSYKYVSKRNADSSSILKLDRRPQKAAADTSVPDILPS